MQDFNADIIRCTTAIELNPKDVSAYLARGRAHRFQGENQEAIDDYSKAYKKIDPTLPMELLLPTLSGNLFALDLSESFFKSSALFFIFSSVRVSSLKALNKSLISFSSKNLHSVIFDDGDPSVDTHNLLLL